MKSLPRLATFVFAMLMAGPSLASPQTPLDTIGSVFLSGAQNYAFRVTPSNPSTLGSSCTGNFLYTNVTDDNYQAYVSTITSAFISHKSVYIVYNVESGFCHIVEFGVSG